MQIFLQTLNAGTYTFSDLGGYSVTHPVGPIPLIEPAGEFYEEDIRDSAELLAAVTAGDIELTDSDGNVLANANDVQNAGDNLGSHIATQALDMASFGLINTNTIDNASGVNQVFTATNAQQQLIANTGASTSTVLLDGAATSITLATVNGADLAGAIYNPLGINWLFGAGQGLLLNSVNATANQVILTTGAATPPVFTDFEIGSLTNVDITTEAPITGSTILWNGTSYVPNNNALFNTNGCFVDFVDDAGLDFCVTQVGTGGSAFYIAKKALGTIASPLPVTDQTKIGGYAFLAFDNATSGPGYVGAEISSTAQGDQDAANGGANLWFQVTPQGTKAPITAFEIEDDGTLTVQGVTDYELQVLDDDDIPNKKYVDDLLDGIDPDLPAIQLRRTTSFAIPNGSFGSIPFDTIDVENDINILERNDLDTPEILIKADGFYLVTYAVHSDGDNNNKDFRVLLNNTTVLEGSQSIRNDSGDTNRSTVGVTIVRQFTAGDFIELQAQGSAANGIIDPPAVFGVVKLQSSGAKGDPGPEGPQGPPGIEGPMPACQVRRTTQLNPIPTTWTDITFDTLDYQNDTAVLERNTTNIDDIDVKVPGLYWVYYNFTGDDEIQGRVRFNDTTVVGGTTKQGGDPGDVNDVVALCTASAVFNVTTPGKFTCQVQAATGGEVLFTNATFLVFKLEGVQGNAGPAGANGADGADGADGQDGPPGFGIYAWADVTGAGVENDGLGLSVVRTGVGTYQYTFDQALANTNYAVDPRAYDAGATDFNTFVNNRTLNGFTVTMGIGDNGGTADVLTDANHTVVVIGPGAGAPSGSNLINVRVNNTPVVDTPHGTVNFSSNFTAVNAGGGIVDVDLANPPLLSTIRVSSLAADQTVNYNINGPEVALVLTGTSTNRGTGATDFTNVNGTITCNFTGSIIIKYTIPHTSTGQRASLKSLVQSNTGGGFTNISGGTYSYVRNSNGHQRDTNTDFDVFSCTAGDQFRIGMRRSEGSTISNAINILENTSITILRIE